MVCVQEQNVPKHAESPVFLVMYFVSLIKTIYIYIKPFNLRPKMEVKEYCEGQN